ncbi:50S ribosomal protein L2 [Candidatus Bathyarchaeota archaeon]|nr:50S ribosomal protein L2 [Candidatus Bathyarchaeota archaeon]
MGKKIRVQRRGGGSPTFRASTHKRVEPSKYSFPEVTENFSAKGTVQELLHEPGRGAPIVRTQFEDGRNMYIVASEGITVGQEIQAGKTAEPAIGNILPLGQITPGSLVCNLELLHGDGGKLVKSSGTYATVVAHTNEGTLVKLPSGKSIYLKDDCLGTLGVISGGGRTDKPFGKAGNKTKWMEAKGRVYPKSRGIAMNAASHPHGGGSHISSSLRPTTVSRNSPPGQKVGLIAARQTGRRKRRTV